MGQDDDRAADEQVRSLLAEAGRTGRSERLPDDVAARLDRTLADLVAEREDAGSVVPLRRRWAPRLVAAAAAVVVLGAGGVATTTLGLFDDSGQADSATSGSAASDSARADSGGSSAKSDARTLEDLPRIASASFDRDVAALLRSDPVPPRPEARPEVGDSVALSCPGPAGREQATRRTVRLDDRLAVLLVQPGRAGRQLVVAWSCDGKRRLASTAVTR